MFLFWSSDALLFVASRTRYVLLLVVVAADTLDCRLIVWFHYRNMLVLEYYVMTRDAAYEKQMKR